MCGDGWGGKSILFEGKYNHKSLDKGKIKVKAFTVCADWHMSSCKPTESHTEWDRDIKESWKNRKWWFMKWCVMTDSLWFLIK